jgi:hypothetical protein
MLNTDDLIDRWALALSLVPDLVAAIGGPQNLIPYKDRFPDQANLRLAIQNMDPGQILIVFMGTDKARMGNGGAWAFRHRFSFYIQAPAVRDGGVSYATIWSLFVNGVHQASGLPLLHTEIDPGCDAMDREGPTSARNSLLVSADGETIDYFEFQASLIEKAG